MDKKVCRVLVTEGLYNGFCSGLRMTTGTAEGESSLELVRGLVSEATGLVRKTKDQSPLLQLDAFRLAMKYLDDKEHEMLLSKGHDSQLVSDYFSDGRNQLGTVLEEVCQY